MAFLTSLNPFEQKRISRVFFVLQNASPDGGQEGHSSCSGEGHLGGGSAADGDGVAVVGGAAGDCGLIGHGQQGAVGGATACAAVSAALTVEAVEACEGWESCEDRIRLTFVLFLPFFLLLI